MSNTLQIKTNDMWTIKRQKIDFMALNFRSDDQVNQDNLDLLKDFIQYVQDGIYAPNHNIRSICQCIINCLCNLKITDNLNKNQIEWSSSDHYSLLCAFYVIFTIDRSFIFSSFANKKLYYCKLLLEYYINFEGYYYTGHCFDGVIKEMFDKVSTDSSIAVNAEKIVKLNNGDAINWITFKNAHYSDNNDQYYIFHFPKECFEFLHDKLESITIDNDNYDDTKSNPCYELLNVLKLKEKLDEIYNMIECC